MSEPIVNVVERDVFGEACGSEGYTTVAEAHDLAVSLQVGEGDIVLELGSGRGWPGRRIAESTGCTVVLSDIPRGEIMEALALGRPTMCGAIVATAAALPFRQNSLDGIVHADVMC